MLSFALDRALWGSWAPGWHLTNLGLHVAAAWLTGELALQLGIAAGPALAGALLFVAHPVQTEAVTYVSGRTDVLCALFALLALLAWRRAARAWDSFALASAAAVAAALLAKEAAVALPLVLFVPGAHPDANPPRPWAPLAVALAWAAAWAGSGGGLHVGGLAGRLPAIGIAALGAVRLLLWPSDLHLERFVPVAGWSTAVAGAWVALGAVLVALYAAARRVPGGRALLALALAAYAPVSGVVPVYPAVADRVLFAAEHFLYLPLAGLAPLAAAAGARALPARVAPAVLAALLAVWGAVVVDRNRDWRDEESLFRQTVAYEPPTARIWFNLGNLALSAGRLEEAERLYEAALVREPRDAAALLNLGIALQRRGRPEEAERRYREAIAADPQRREAYQGLAGILAARGALDEAAAVLERGGLRPGQRR
jgi:tetratricopeptide (TPR) repeat protein